MSFIISDFLLLEPPLPPAWAVTAWASAPNVITSLEVAAQSIKDRHFRPLPLPLLTPWTWTWGLKHRFWRRKLQSDPTWLLVRHFKSTDLSRAEMKLPSFFLSQKIIILTTTNKYFFKLKLVNNIFTTKCFVKSTIFPSQ